MQLARMNIVIHLLLLITIKRGNDKMSQRPIKRKNMNVSGLTANCIQYKNLNIHKHSLSSKVFNIEQ